MNKITIIKLKKIKKLQDKGLPIRDIARCLQVSRTAIYKALEDLETLKGRKIK